MRKQDSVASLQDKVVVVTGASAGIGREIARAAFRAGAKVVVHGRRQPELQALSEELQCPGDYVIADLRDPESPRKVIDFALELHGRIDGLVNNAGIFPRGRIEDADMESYDLIFSVNLRAPLFLSQKAIAVFRTQKIAGSIVNIGSINAWCGQPDLLIYSLSKGALMTMTRNLADALGTEGIRVNQMNVGWTRTEKEDQIQRAQGRPADWAQRIPGLYAPIGRILLPKEIAPHVVFWLSDASRPVSGAVYELEQYPVLGRNRMADF